MGRLRHDEDFSFLSSIATEVVDLFGTEAILYRFTEAPTENTTVRDPLYDEPGFPHTVQRKAYNILLHWQDLVEGAGHFDTGMNFENSASAFVALDHLVSVGVKADGAGDFISEGDVIQVHRGKHTVTHWDVINTNKTGFANDSHQYVGYSLKLNKNTNFDPSRNDGVR